MNWLDMDDKFHRLHFNHILLQIFNDKYSQNQKAYNYICPFVD
jgi:hypothetical protein